MTETLTQPLSRIWIMRATFVVQAAVLIATKPIGLTWSLRSHVHHAFRGHYFAIVATLFVVAAAVCSFLVSRIVVVRAPVLNVANPLVLLARVLPIFVQQDRNSESMLRFRSHLQDVLEKVYPDSLSKAVALRRWVREQQSQDVRMWLTPARHNHENPHDLLHDQRNGVPGSCRRFSYILVGALLSAGFDARIVCFTSTLHRRRAESHVGVEVWIEDLEQWVFFDPTCDTMIRVDGKLVSAIELHEAVVNGRLDTMVFDRGGSSLEPHPKAEVYKRCCRHVFVAMANAVFDGYAVRLLGTKRISFLHYSKEEAYPEFRKQVLIGMGANGLFLGAVFWFWALVL